MALLETPLVQPLPTIPLDLWRGEYYANAGLLGQPTLVREDAELNFNWLLDSPAPSLPADNFSVRWLRIIDFAEGGNYRFFAHADDGVRLYLDGWRVIDGWTTTGAPATRTGTFKGVTPGLHSVIVEYFESGGQAQIKVWWEPD